MNSKRFEHFVKELQWRGMVHDIMPGTEDQLKKEMTCGYIGFDPTSDSLHIGSLVQIIILMHFQKCGHVPIILVGGATGMVGDPSGKSKERNLLTPEEIQHNLEAIKNQLSHFLDFECNSNPAVIVNNFDWFSPMSFLDFIRDVGKHITINYMMSKDSVKSRLESGMSFTEFSYQLVQGYDFYHLFMNNNCKVQLGGSDQWGNIVTGTELIRRKAGGEAYAMTTPLIMKADGGKFGKTEEGNVWLDKDRTSPYKFYQYWLNVSDEDAGNFIKIFTFLSKEEVSTLIEEHRKEPHLRILQNKLACEVTEMVHGKKNLESALAASAILFGKGTTQQLAALDEITFLSAFEGVPVFDVSLNLFANSVDLFTLLTELTQIFPSKGEVRRTIQGGGLSINKEKVKDTESPLSLKDLISGKYILIQKGKKNYYIIRVNQVSSKV